jgi:quercetin dioxygenase-like cupin family protein
MRILFATFMRLAGTVAPAQDAKLATLMENALAAQPDHKVTMLTVEYPPGGSSKPHRHDAQVFVYVLDGAITMQVKGGPLRTLKAGDTFYEAPNDEHIVSANASRTQAAKFLVFIIKDASTATRSVEDKKQ